jgi:hypothetical protein
VGLIRYKPGEAIRWLEMGAQDFRKNAQRQGKSLVRREGERNVSVDFKQAAGAIMDFGKGAWVDLMHRLAQASEYVLSDEYFEIVSSTRLRPVRYDDVDSIRIHGDKATLVLDRGSVVIKPHAYIVSGRVKVPIGWSRNDIEVPYEVLLDELSARCGVEVEHQL